MKNEVLHGFTSHLELCQLPAIIQPNWESDSVWFVKREKNVFAIKIQLRLSLDSTETAETIVTAETTDTLLRLLRLY